MNSLVSIPAVPSRKPKPLHKITGAKLSSRAIRSTAFHEIGHVIVGLEDGYTLDYVTVEPQIIHGDGRREYVKDLPALETLTQGERYYLAWHTKDSYGHVTWNPGISIWDRDALPMIMAGEIARARAGHRAWRNGNGDPSSDDESIQHISSLQGIKDLQPYRQRAVQAVEKQWPVIESLAALLQERHTLSSEDVKSHIGRAVAT